MANQSAKNPEVVFPPKINDTSLMITVTNNETGFQVKFKDWADADRYLFCQTTLAEWTFKGREYTIIVD